MDRSHMFQESHKHVDDADLEVEIQRELEEEEEALRSAWKSRQREQTSLLYTTVTTHSPHPRLLPCRLFCATCFKTCNDAQQNSQQQSYATKSL